MATSGSTDYSQTRDDIIKRALRLIGALAQGESPTTYQATDTPDFPQEWYDAVTYGLATRLAPEYKHWIPVEEVYEGSQAICFTCRPFASLE